MRDFLRSPLARVWAPVLGLASVVAYLDRGTDTGDLIFFVHKGGQLLSGDWADTFADESLQVGPVLLAIVGAVGNFTALAFLIELGAAALLLYVLRRLDASDRVRLVVGLLAVVSGLTHGAFVDGHPAQVFVPLLWVLAAVWAREGRAVAAGALIGASAGLELWGVLGAVVLLLAPSLRRTVAGVFTEAAVVCALLAPFALFGTFRMFEHEWAVATGTLLSLFVELGTDFGWPLRLLQASFALCAGGTIALALRRNLHAVWLAPLGLVCVRLVLDPLAYGWYWLAAHALVLVGAALVLGSLSTRALGASGPPSADGRFASPRYSSVEK
jgi:hypothetical protein